MSGVQCSSCGGIDTLEYHHESNTLACTRCGTVAAASSSQGLEFLAREDEDDPYKNGRTYIGGQADKWGGVGAFAAARAGGRASQWASSSGQGRAIYHAKKRNDAETFLRRVLNRFDLYNPLATRTKWLFSQIKQKVGFRWGLRAEVFAAACVYVAAKESERELWLNQVADTLDSQIKEPGLQLSRAIRIVKLELSITLLKPEVDPAMHLERILVHLQSLFSTPKPPLHGSSNSKKTTWTPSNLTWVRGLSLAEVRTLAVNLLAFSSDISLVSGRSPEQVACAAIMVALEGVARKPAPLQQEFCDEMAWVMGTRAFTVQERYREFNKALADYAPKLPWLGAAAAAKCTKKKNLVVHTSDIVQFRKAIDTKAKRQRVAAEEARVAQEKGKGKVEYDDEALPGGGGGSDDLDIEDDEDDEEQRNDDPHDACFPDPLLNPQAAAKYNFTAEPPASKLVPGRGLKKGTAIGAGDPSAPACTLKRPAEYMRVDPASKRQKAIESAMDGLASSLVGPSPTASPASFASASPAPFAASASPPPVASTSTSVSLPHSAPSVLPAHDPRAIEIRQLLLAGHDPSNIRTHLSRKGDALPPMGSTSRLKRLLWDKSAKELDDDELFEEGELEGYIRNGAELETYTKLPWTQAMLADAEAWEAKDKGNKSRPKRRRRGQLNENYEEEFREAAAKGARGTDATTSRLDRDDRDGFRPRQRKTKLKEGAKARLEALLRLDDDDANAEEGGGGGGAERGHEPWLDLALDAARDVGENIPDEEDDHGDEYASEPDGAGEDQDWRTTAFRGYGQPNEDDEYDE
ncbi:hypothetical protein JCM21900_004536 [Sporobolomyces salmonicolor]